MSFPNSDLTNANQRVAQARERLDLQRDRIQKLRTDRHDTNDAEAAFRTMRRTLETYEEDRREIEEEVIGTEASARLG
jgi:predicted  nucleic acid-binding Zn-ribbon protein